MIKHIPFSKPFLTNNEIVNIKDVLSRGKLSGNNYYTDLCHKFFENRYNFKKVLLTSSCTDALEMCAILLNIKEGDEVIIPSYTFVSTANAFILRGAKIIFADSSVDNPNIDSNEIEKLISSKTKAIVVVHYAGISCDLEKIIDISNKYNIPIVEDAAQAIDNYFIDKNGNKKPLGSIGNLSALSFHETKNIISGEGGLLVVNDKNYVKRAEIIWEKGTNRSAFFRGEVDKYNWVDVGSSFLPSELTAAFLYAQLCSIDLIQNKRKQLWNMYYDKLKSLKDAKKIQIPSIPTYSSNNAHIFYLLTQTLEERTNLLNFLKEKNINAVFHYISLHKSDFFKDSGKYELKMSDYYTDNLIRLPLYVDMNENEINYIVDAIKDFYA